MRFKYMHEPLAATVVSRSPTPLAGDIDYGLKITRSAASTKRITESRTDRRTVSTVRLLKCTTLNRNLQFG